MSNDFEKASDPLTFPMAAMLEVLEDFCEAARNGNYPRLADCLDECVLLGYLEYFNADADRPTSPIKICRDRIGGANVLPFPMQNDL